MGIWTPVRRIPRSLPVVTIAILVGGCWPTAAVRSPPTATPSASSSPDASLSPTPSPGESPTPTPTLTAPPTPTPTPTGVDPGFVPALAAIQMVGPRLGWAVGSHAIFATTDGTHWTKQYASTEAFVGVDFTSATMGWPAPTRSLRATTAGGHTCFQLGEPHVPIRAVHFATATQGWVIA